MTQIKTSDATLDELSDVLASLDILDCCGMFFCDDGSSINENVMKNIITMDDYNFSENDRGSDGF